MTNRTKIYFIISQRKVVSLKDLQDITNWKPITILRAVAPLIIKRKIKALTHSKLTRMTMELTKMKKTN